MPPRNHTAAFYEFKFKALPRCFDHLPEPEVSVIHPDQSTLAWNLACLEFHGHTLPLVCDRHESEATDNALDAVQASNDDTNTDPWAFEPLHRRLALAI
jgi:hypothetical protein